MRRGVGHARLEQHEVRSAASAAASASAVSASASAVAAAAAAVFCAAWSVSQHRVDDCRMAQQYLDDGFSGVMVGAAR